MISQRYKKFVIKREISLSRSRIGLTELWKAEMLTREEAKRCLDGVKNDYLEIEKSIQNLLA